MGKGIRRKMSFELIHAKRFLQAEGEGEKQFRIWRKRWYQLYDTIQNRGGGLGIQNGKTQFPTSWSICKKKAGGGGGGGVGKQFIMHGELGGGALGIHNAGEWGSLKKEKLSSTSWCMMGRGRKIFYNSGKDEGVNNTKLEFRGRGGAWVFRTWGIGGC